MKRQSKQFFLWIQSHAGLSIILVFLAIHLFTINDYGFTWDFHFHFFGGGKLLGYEPKELEPRNLPFVEPDPRKAWTLPYGPIMTIPPIASYFLLYRISHLLPADTAYHLPIILWGILGIGVIYLFSKEAINRRVAIYASLFLALTPRYFGDLHNNMKDIPSAVMFAVNIWALWRLIYRKRFIDLFIAVAMFAVAFNVKVNSIFVPIIFIIWLLFSWLYQKKSHRFMNSNVFKVNYSLSAIYFFIAPLAAYILWWVFWPDPIGQLGHAFMTFGVGTNNMEVPLNGSWYCSGSTVPWYYPYWYLAITTPLPILIFFLIGIGVSIFFVSKYFFTAHNSQLTAHSNVFAIPSMNGKLITLLLLWLFLPLTRYFVPNIGVIDGIRHFEEVLFPIAILAAIGLDHIFSFARGRLAKLILFILIISYLGFINYQYHPYQITYFNQLVGGTKGAVGKYDLDYWGTSQKEAVLWVNEQAPQNAKVHIVMAAAVAGQYLRPDLVTNLNKYSYENSDFVILLNRQSFLYRFFYAYEYLLHHTPIHTIQIQEAPLTWIYDNRTNNKTERQTPWWKDEDPCIIKYWRGEHL